MKKLMFGLAVAAVGSAFAVESSNIVGYSESALSYDGDSLILCPQFVGVGTVDGSLDLNTIKCEETKAARDNVIVMKLYGDGSMREQYQWTRDGDYFWQDGATGEQAEDVYLEPGEAVWVQCNADDLGVHFKSSGQVAQEDIDVDLVNGEAVICGNATPVEIDLNDILCPATKAARDNVIIMKLAGDGSMLEQYQWTRDGEYFWQDGSTGEQAENVSLLPGEGVWVQCNAEGEDEITITFPGFES